MFQLLFKFGEWFSHFSRKDDWSQIVKRYCTRMYTFGCMSYVLLTMSRLNVENRRLSRCSYFVYVESGK